MMRIKRSIVFTLMLLSIYIGSIYALENNIGGDVRSAAMGYVKVAEVGERLSFMNNPACFDQLKLSVTGASTELFGTGIIYQYFETGFLVSPSWKFSMGLEKLLDQDDIDPIGYGQQHFAVGFANKVSESIQLGFGLRFEQFKLLKQQLGKGRSLEAGVRFSLWNSRGSQLSLGFKLSNLAALRQYGNRTEIPPLGIGIGVSGKGGPLIYSLELLEQEIRAGFEYKLSPSIALRAGMVQGQPTFGIGLSQGKLRLDYAYWLADMGATHRFGSTIVF